MTPDPKEALERMVTTPSPEGLSPENRKLIERLWGPEVSRGSEVVWTLHRNDISELLDAARSESASQPAEVRGLVEALEAISKLPISDGSEGELDIGACLIDYDGAIIHARLAMAAFSISSGEK